MKTCPVCHYENQNEAQYCAQCGASIQNAGPAMKQTDWFFVENKSPHGPFSEEEMVSMIQQGRIKQNTFIWQSEYSDWKHLEDSELATYLKKESPKPEPAENPLYATAKSFASYPVENEPVTQPQNEPAPAMETHGQEYYGNSTYSYQGYQQPTAYPADANNPYQTQSFSYDYSSYGQPYNQNSYGQGYTQEFYSQESYGMQNPQTSPYQPGYSYTETVTETVSPASAAASASNDWYYTLNGEIFGPFSQALFSQMVQNGQVAADAYVWKEGMADWQPLMESSFASQMPQPSYSYNQGYPEQTNPYQEPQTAYTQPQEKAETQTFKQEESPKEPPIFTNLKPRSVPLFFTMFCASGIVLGLIWLLAQSFLQIDNLFLSLAVAAGIGLIQVIILLVWIVLLAKNVQTLSMAYLKESFPQALPAILIGIISFGVYLLYYLWRMEATISQIRVQGKQVRKTSFLAIILIPVALCILQDQVNEIIYWESQQAQEQIPQTYGQQPYMQGYPMQS